MFSHHGFSYVLHCRFNSTLPKTQSRPKVIKMGLRRDLRRLYPFDSPPIPLVPALLLTRAPREVRKQILQQRPAFGHLVFQNGIVKRRSDLFPPVYGAELGQASHFVGCWHDLFAFVVTTRLPRSPRPFSIANTAVSPAFRHSTALQAYYPLVPNQHDSLPPLPSRISFSC
jgi:hypothetical protein